MALAQNFQALAISGSDDVEPSVSRNTKEITQGKEKENAAPSSD